MAENEVFLGKGELCRRLTDWDPRILVLPTEVAKVYMDELNGQVNPALVVTLRKALGWAMHGHSQAFLRIDNGGLGS